MLRFMILHHEGFPIRKSVDIMLICSSPRLIAACHVLHRLLMPRHSPYALVRLNFLYIVPILWFSLNCLSFFEHFSFRIIDSLTHEKTFFAFCTCYLSCAFAPRLRAFHLSVKLYAHFRVPFPFRLERLIYLLRLFVLFCSFSTQNTFFYSIVKDLLESLQIPASFALAKSCRTRFSKFCGRSGWTRTIDLALIRRAL